MNRQTAMGWLCGLILLPLSITVSIAPARCEENSARDSAASVAGLLEQLELSDSMNTLQRRRDAARQLSRMNPLPDQAIAPLAKALNTFDRGGVQRYASDALVGAGARAIPALAAECNQGVRDDEGCQASIGVLGKIALSEPDALPILIDDLRSGYGAGAAVALGKVGAPAVRSVRQALKSDNPKTRAMAAKALSDIGAPAKDAISDLLPLLNDAAGSPASEWPSPVVCNQAALALANISPARTEALPVLIGMLMTQRGLNAIDAVKAVAQMGRNARDAVPALEHMLAADPDNLDRSFAVDALPAIEGRSAEPALARVLKNDKDSAVRFHAARALANLGPECPETIPALAGALNDSEVDSASQLVRLGKPGLAALAPALKNPDFDVRRKVVEALSGQAMRAPWAGPPGGTKTQVLPDELVQPLMAAMNDKSIAIREQAARALQFGGEEPARLAQAELEREQKISAQESALDKTPRSREEITAPIPSDEEHKYPLKLEYLFPIYNSVSVEPPDYLISLHRGRERGDRLAFWKKAGGHKYERVKVMESSEVDPGEGRFLPPKLFRAKVQVRGEGRPFDEFQRFVDVPQTGCNTWCVFDNIFAISGGDLIPVQIESPEKWYKSKLKAGESTWHSNANSFSDDNLSFRFMIWEPEDPHASPSGGKVIGTYKIIRETTGQAVAGVSMFGGLPTVPAKRPAPGQDNHPVTWRMVVDTAERR